MIAIASGVLPITISTRQLCLGWRSKHEKHGNCYSVIGGMMHDEPGIDLAGNVAIELAEETGYSGPIELHHAFVYTKPGFRYHNFIGIVPEPFPFNPNPEFSFEIDHIDWMNYESVVAKSIAFPKMFHPGLLELLQKSKNLIEKFV